MARRAASSSASLALSAAACSAAKRGGRRGRALLRVAQLRSGLLPLRLEPGEQRDLRDAREARALRPRPRAARRAGACRAGRERGPGSGTGGGWRMCRGLAARARRRRHPP